MQTTTKPSTESMNRVIAEFMGLEKCQRCVDDCGHYKYSGAYFTPAEMSYNCSWDWLMPVYNKVNQFYINHNSNENKTADEKYDIDLMIKLHKNVMGYLATGNIEWTHAAIYNFITWYNQHTSPNKSGD